MKTNLLTVLLLLTLLIISCRKERVIGSTAYITKPLKDSVQAIVDKYIGLGIPGIEVAVKDDHDFFTTNGGYSSLEEHTPMNLAGTDWIFSITKTYTAVLLMKEVEKGSINLDGKIRNYLSAPYADNIVGSDVVTVRMLLNHTSGIIDFSALPEFIEEQFKHPLQQPSVKEKIELIYGHPLAFQPGTDFSYCNTNYLLLHVILENVTGKSYESLLRSEIIQPLQLKNTWYGIGDEQIKNLKFPNYYFDPQASGELLNATAWNIALGNTSLGYGGIAAQAADVIKFYKALINGDVVSKKSFKEMTAWIQGKGSYQPDYGLGIEYYQFAPGTTAQFGHEGDGVGATTQIMYVPDTHVYLYINCTVGRKIPGPFLYKTTDFKNELCAFVAKWR